MSRPLGRKADNRVGARQNRECGHPLVPEPRLFGGVIYQFPGGLLGLRPVAAAGDAFGPVGIKATVGVRAPGPAMSPPGRYRGPSCLDAPPLTHSAGSSIVPSAANRWAGVFSHDFGSGKLLTTEIGSM